MNLTGNISLNESTFNSTDQNSSLRCPTYDMPDESSELLSRANYVISKVFPPIFLLIGIPGNLLTIAVIIRQRKTMTYNAATLLFVAIADLIPLLSHFLLDWIVAITAVKYSTLSRTFCQPTIFLTLSSCTISSLGLVAITAERVACVVRPYDAKRVFTPKVSLLIMSTTSTVVFGLCGYVFIDDIPERDEFESMYGWSCSTAYSDYVDDFSFACIVILTTLSCYIPLVLLCVGNVVLVWKLYKRKQVPSSSANSTNTTNQRHRLYVLVIMLNVMFLISQFPYAVIIYYADDLYTWMSVAICSDEFAFRVGVAKLFYNIANIFSILNPSLNYLLYFVSSPRFRKEIKAFFKCQTAGRSNIFDG